VSEGAASSQATARCELVCRRPVPRLVRVDEAETEEEDGATESDCALHRPKGCADKLDGDAPFLIEILVASHRPPRTAPAVQRP
jgi:hypothetical protein